MVVRHLRSVRSLPISHLPPTIPTTFIPLSRGMPTQRRRRRSISETDEEIPALQSPSDSSESEDSPIIPPRPLTVQDPTPPPRPLAAGVFDSDDSDMDITESGTVIQPFDSRIND